MIHTACAGGRTKRRAAAEVAMRSGSVREYAGHRHREFNGRDGPVAAFYDSLPWQCLYFLPEPQGQGSLRPTLGASR